MANRALFKSQSAADKLPPATVTNDAGGRAYEASPKFTLALYACVGTFNSTFYVKAEDHLARVKELLAKVDDLEFIAKCAVYAREKSHMKDVPAFLAAWVFAQDKTGDIFAKIFPRVIDNGKMFCNFWQIVRSGSVSRKSFGSRAKRALRAWFDGRSDDAIFRASIGTANPSLADVIRVVHPRAPTEERSALFGYISGRGSTRDNVQNLFKRYENNLKPRGGHMGYDPSRLPALVRSIEAFKLDQSKPVPDVSFQLLSSMPLAEKHWKEIAANASWQTTRMNLNTFNRHGVLADDGLMRKIAAKLRDEAEVKRARVFPYQLLIAYKNAEDMPRPIVEALHDAMEIATSNVPTFAGNVVICPDVSGSMSSPVTGFRDGPTSSKVRCLDVAALVAACIMRKNPEARILPFEGDVIAKSRMPKLDPRDSVMTNAEKLARIGGGATNCGAPLALLNREKARVDGVFYISDSESWVDTTDPDLRMRYGHKTGMGAEWATIAARNPKAKLLCNDIQVHQGLQTAPHDAILNIGGFSDEVFTVASLFLNGELGSSQWLARIEEGQL